MLRRSRRGILTEDSITLDKEENPGHRPGLLHWLHKRQPPALAEGVVLEYPERLCFGHCSLLGGGVLSQRHQTHQSHTGNVCDSAGID